MESVNEVKQALSARSRTATLEELAKKGRKQVRLIKAEHVAAMITAAVNTAIQESGFIPKEEADNLVSRSRDEFKSIIAEREAELRRMQTLEELLKVREEQLERMQADLEEARQALEAQAEAATVGGQLAAGQPMPMFTPEQLAALTPEQRQAMQAAASAQAAGQMPGMVMPDFGAALDKLASSLNERLEKLGQKMGISSAVEGAEVNFDALFNNTGPDLESNMENIQIKKKAGGGIAANLERLKKLKGGG